ncbi:MAG: BatA domain-containing protein, partial [Paracoccaceae bacterium]
MIAILSSLSFGAPLVLLGLLVIPLIWILLRAIPPAPIRRIFPAVVLLLGLQDKKQTSDRTPWWLLLLRSLALAALIIGMAGPALNRQNAPSSASDILLLVDGSWATGQGWSGMRELVEQEVANAVRRGVKVALLDLSAPASISFRPASLFEGTAQGLVPKPFDPDWTAAQDAIASLGEEGFDTIWFSDGLAHGSDKQSLLLTLKSKGTVSVYETERNVITLSSVSLLEQSFEVRLHRL